MTAELGWLAGQRIAPHIPVWDKSRREDCTLSRQDFRFDKKGDVVDRELPDFSCYS